jgi:hypothetical protein
MTIHVDFRKWPDTRHWQFTMRHLGEDEHGTWLWAPEGTRAQRGHDAPIKFETPSAKLITEDWWTAIWSPATDGSDAWRVYVDIIRPATWHDSTVTMIDLDLDVYRKLDGVVRLLDEDEFAEHQVSLHYPPELIDGAREAADRILVSVERGDEPFGEVGRAWLRKAQDLAASEARSALRI